MNEERMRILKMIEEGTVTAEEGAKLLNAVEEKEGNQRTTSEKRRYGVKNFIGDAIEKIKNVDFDLSFGEYVEFDYETQTEPEDFKDIDLSIANGSLEMETWKEPYVKASYRVRVYQVETEEEARERFLADGQFSINNGLLRLASPSKKMKTSVRMFVPEHRYEFIKAKLTNGSITLSQLTSEHFQLKTSNGKVELNKVDGGTCKVETGNGSITLKDGVFDTCETDSLNGSITLGGEFGKSDASAVSGSITVNHFGEKAHTGFYKTTTGSVNVALPNHKRVDGVLKSSFGSLHCQLDNYKILNDKKEMVNKQLEFEALEEYESAYHIEAETKTGSVTIKPASDV